MKSKKNSQRFKASTRDATTIDTPQLQYHPLLQGWWEEEEQQQPQSSPPFPASLVILPLLQGGWEEGEEEEEEETCGEALKREG